MYLIVWKMNCENKRGKIAWAFDTPGIILHLDFPLVDETETTYQKTISRLNQKLATDV